jgi:hypothetical protein
MARPRRQFEGSLSPGQAHYVLERLIKDRRVSANEINGYISEMGREISDLEEKLARLRSAAGPAAAAAAAGIAAGIAGAAAVRRGKRGRPPGRPGRPPGRPGRPPGRPPASASSETAAGGAKRGRKARTSSAITPEQLASRQLQGRYLALVRRFPEAKRTQYAKIAKDKGREAAIKEMQDAMKK